jgi:hypothetical protein
MSRSLWQLLIQRRDCKEDIPITCDECFLLLEYDADLLANGTQFDELQPVIKKHLQLCTGCRLQLTNRIAELEQADK